MRLVTVIPTYNEARNLERLGAALLALDIPGLEIQLLVIDDASPDGTAQIADQLRVGAPGRVEVVQRGGKRGLGTAYVEGFAHALAQDADLVAQMDADLSHDPAALLAMVESIRDADLVIASRYTTGGGVDVEWPWHRKLLSWLANAVVVPSLLSLPLTDATSGYRLWRRETLARVAPSVNVKSNGYGFQVEMAYLTHRLGCRIKEVPIYFRERDSGRSKMNLREGLSAVREIVTIPRKHRERDR